MVTGLKNTNSAQVIVITQKNMTRTFTPEEAKQNYINIMGNELGEVYNELWQDVSRLHIEWREYVELFGTKPLRVNLLNKAAPQFFYIIEKSLWDTILVHITRLTDPPQSMNRKNLSLQQLKGLIDVSELNDKLSQSIKITLEKTQFYGDWRNRHIVHNDYELALYNSSKPLEFASRKLVVDAIEAIDSVMNCISLHFEKSTTDFDLLPNLNGAFSLLYVIANGLKYIEERKNQNTNSTNDDLSIEDL